MASDAAERAKANANWNELELELEMELESLQVDYLHVIYDSASNQSQN